MLAAARKIGAPESLVLTGLGLGSTLVPGLPPVRVDPQLMLTLFLPPLIYASSVRVSWHLLRVTLLPGVVLGAVLVLVTIAAVGGAVHGLLLPGLSWPGALLIGIAVAIFDTRLFHEAKGRPHVPRAIADTLKARELVGRVFILATLALVLEAAAEGQFSPFSLVRHYALNIPAGLGLGFAVGRGVAWIRQRIEPAPVEIAASLATPYASALLASLLGISAVAAIVPAALVVSAVRIDRRTGAPISSSETRISAVAFWEQVNLMLSSALFFLAGRGLPESLATVESWPAWRLVACIAGILAVVIAVQFAFSFVGTALHPVAEALAARKDASGARRAAAAGVMTWSATRSIIGIVVALSIPETMPERDLVLVVAALAITLSVLLQGLTLRAVVAGARLADDEDDSEADAARRAIQEALAAPGREHANGFDAARQALVRLRERDVIGDEVLIEMLRETDLSSRAVEGDALPGAGPPTP